MYSTTQASTAACAASIDVNGPASSRKSGPNVPWKRSTFPFWFGEAGAVSRCVIPFLRQILSKSTSPLRAPCLPNRSVNCFPLSLSTSSGTPNRTSACVNATHTARPVARATTFAITQNREWSSTPVTTFADRTTPVTGSTTVTPSTMSTAHNCIGAGRSHRTYDFRDRFRGRDRTSPWRVKIRLIVAVEGTTTPSLTHGPGRRASSIPIRLAPHRGCSRRISATRTSTVADTRCGQEAGRCDRSARPATPSTRYRAIQACNDCRDTPTDAATSELPPVSRTPILRR